MCFSDEAVFYFLHEDWIVALARGGRENTIRVITYPIENLRCCVAFTAVQLEMSYRQASILLSHLCPFRKFHSYIGGINVDGVMGVTIERYESNYDVIWSLDGHLECETYILDDLLTLSLTRD